MVKRFLVTTALEETWPADGPILFLGEWCRRYSRKEIWSKLDADVLPYHWDDRAKLHEDYVYLQGFYERLLQELTVQLNEIHGVDHSLRYWRILIGPWLGYFIQMLFDRWASVQQIIDLDLSGTITLTGHDEELVPYDMDDFTRLFTNDDWNHHLYSYILSTYTKLPCQLKARDVATVAPQIKPSRRRIVNLLMDLYVRSARLVSSDRDAFLMGTYLPFRDEMKIHRLLGQLPQPWRPVPPNRSSLNPELRRWTVRGENRSNYESCARAMIPRQIPTLYLEGYLPLTRMLPELPWPRRPMLIWTSNAHNYDEVFKAWTAEKVEQGAPLIVGQHGGHDGVGRWSFTEDHKIAISDRYLSWGWSESKQPKVKPVGQLKSNRPLGVSHAGQPYALLVTTTIPRQSYQLFSIIVARQWLDYFKDQCDFVGALPESIRRALIVRLYSSDYGWDQVPRWRDRFPDVHLDEGQADMKQLIRRSRLYISTYNATTYLESFTMDVPTIIYWDPKAWELRDSAIPYFEELARVGVFHKDPVSAARQVAKVWNNIDAWWLSPDVRKTVERFREQYCVLSDDLLERVDNSLREVFLSRC